MKKQNVFYGMKKAARYKAIREALHEAFKKHTELSRKEAFHAIGFSGDLVAIELAPSNQYGSSENKQPPASFRAWMSLVNENIICPVRIGNKNLYKLTQSSQNTDAEVETALERLFQALRAKALASAAQDLEKLKDEIRDLRQQLETQKENTLTKKYFQFSNNT